MSKKIRKDRKFNKTTEWLYEEYVVKNRDRKEIAKECGLTEAGLKSTLSKYGIKKPKLEIPVEEVKQLLENGNSVKFISNKFNCEETTIYRIMKKHKLTINYKPDYNQYDDSNDELICSLYLDGHSSTEIAKIIGTTHRSILSHLDHCGIKRRNFVECQFNYRNHEIPKELYDYDYMYDIYITQRKSKKDVAKLLNIETTSVDTALRKLGIPIRGNSEAKIGLQTGSNHHNWKGGITPLHLRLREAFQVQLTPHVLKRDNYKCQICGATGKLHVHHIKHFKDILSEIVLEHPDLNPVDNLEELYNIAVKDSRFLDLDNLITYCPYCHYNIAHKRS